MTRCQYARLFAAAGLALDGDCLIDLAQSRTRVFDGVRYDLCLPHSLEFAMVLRIPEKGYCEICYSATENHNGRFCTACRWVAEIAERAVSRAVARGSSGVRA